MTKALRLDQKTVRGDDGKVVIPIPRIAVLYDTPIYRVPVRVEIWEEGIVRIQDRFPPQEWNAHSTIVPEANQRETPFRVKDGKVVRIETKLLTLLIDKSNGQFQIIDRQNDRTLCEEPEGVYERWVGPGARQVLKRRKGDCFYGLGLRDRELNRSGKAFHLWNNHNPTWRTDVGISEIASPLLVSSRGYGILLNTTYPSEFDLTRDDEFSFRSEDCINDFFIIHGPSLAEIMERYNRLMGPALIPPRWSLGYLQSKNSYETQAETQEIARIFREKQIPCDGIFCDVLWYISIKDYNGTTGFDFARDRWPKAEEMVRDLAQGGFRWIPILKPFLRRNHPLYAEWKAKGYFAQEVGSHQMESGEVKREIEGRANVTTSYDGSLVDFSNPEARHAWGSAMKPLIEMGIEGWWLDEGEPADHYQRLFHHKGSWRAEHNVHDLLWSEAIAESMQRHEPDKRWFTLSRSGYSGKPRFGAFLWSGDSPSCFEELAALPAVGVNCAMSGFPYWGSDIGGYPGPIDPELFTRWFEFSVFTPLFHAHGVGSREPWALGPETEDILRRLSNLRYRLMPYIYTLAWKSYDRGWPMMRPLAWYYPDNPKIRNLGSQYMLGPALMIAPVAERGARTREVYLPKGIWFDFHTGRRIKSAGRTIPMDAPLGQPPILARAGSIIPMAPIHQHASPAAFPALELRIYPGQDGEFTLYEDDGETMGYRNETWAKTRISYSESANGARVLVEPPKGAFPVPPRPMLLRLPMDRRPKSAKMGKVELDSLDQPLEIGEIQSGWHYDASAHELLIGIEGSSKGTLLTISF